MKNVLMLMVLLVVILCSFLFSAENENLTLEQRVLVLETKVKMLEERMNAPAQQTKTNISNQTPIPVKIVEKKGWAETEIEAQNRDRAIKEKEQEQLIQDTMKATGYDREKSIRYIEAKKRKQENKK